MFCPNCGKLVPDHTTQCPACSAVLARSTADPISHSVVPRQGHSWVVTLLLALFIPLFGVHRFYTGHILYGIVQLVTCGGCGILWLIDVILILFDAYEDADGLPLVK
jgi:TM2 domain-containing membrane protein YozV